MAIYSQDYIPYFYIIQDVRNGMYYAGSKYGKDANPSNFMIEGGYETSSETIRNIIKEYGFDIFVIRKIKTFETGPKAHRYETRFLQKIDAKNHPKFYNKHNNDYLLNFVSKEFEEMMLEYYGVTHPIYSKEIGQRKEETCKVRYGVEHYSKTKEYRIKFVDTSLKRYETEHPMQNDIIKNKVYGTKQLRYNNPTFVNPEKMKKTKLEKYGNEKYNNSEKAKETKMERYGSSSYVNPEKAKLTSMERYGVDNGSKTPEARNKISNHMQKLLSRENVKELTDLIKTNNIILGRNWNRRSDEWIDSKIEEIKKNM